MKPAGIMLHCWLHSYTVEHRLVTHSDEKAESLCHEKLGGKKSNSSRGETSK